MIVGTSDLETTVCMTTTYEPTHPLYFDEAAVRNELTRAYDICNGCRSCVGLCGVFPTLFDLLGSDDDQTAGSLTPAQQDGVVDQCYQCTLCSVDCPYTPGLHDWNLDVPRLMVRAKAMQHASGITSARSRRTTRVVARTDRIGAIATRVSGPANSIITATAGSALRKAVTAFVGVSSTRLLPPFTKQRFSTWFRQRPTISLTARQGRVTVFPTCLVEYHEADIGKDLVKVYERNGIECSTSRAGCCGAPWLHSGNVEAFTKIAEKNVKALVAEVRSGTEVVVPQPTCTSVIKHDYPHYITDPVLRSDAEIVAAHTADAAQYLMRIHRADDTVLDTDFQGEIVGSITYHAPCHQRAQDDGFASRDLMRLTGASVDVVQQCSGVGGGWGLRADHEQASTAVARALGHRIEQAGGDLVAGDCHLANLAIVEQTGRSAQHPLQLLARAYGIAEEH